MLIVSFDGVSGGAFLGNKTAIRGWKLEFTSEETEALKSQTLIYLLLCFFHIDLSLVNSFQGYDDVSDLLLQSLKQGKAQYRFMPRLMDEQL